jgi:trehalose 6-phosphate synthase/phosphatase
VRRSAAIAVLREIASTLDWRGISPPVHKQRLVVVSNRLPIAVEPTPTGSKVVSGSGGLVTALGPVLGDRGGKWIGWLGLTGFEETRAALDEAEEKLGYPLEAVELTAEEIAGFYEGFANEVLWPLFHDFIPHCVFDPSYWPIYQRANRKFAEATARVIEDGDYVWIHDYHLMSVGAELRRMGVAHELGFFLHIPFPSLDMFSKMPWRQNVLEGLLDYDLLGFQTARDLRNFAQCVLALVDGARVHETGDLIRVEARGRTVRAGAFPISIDYEDFVHRAVENPVSELVARVRSQLPNRKLILGLDRLDYTKGIPERIRAFGLALERYPELRGNVTFLQVVIPSRTRVDEYAHLKDEIDRLIGSVGGRFSQAGWSPIQYLFRRLTEKELLAYYRACDVALITPLKDGMNLVAKEYCACSLEDNGVIILSEFAGAAAQLREGAIIVNPFDIEAVAEAIHEAVLMDPDDRRARMRPLRESIRREDIYDWVDTFLAAAQTARVEAAAAGGSAPHH